MSCCGGGGYGGSSGGGYGGGSYGGGGGYGSSGGVSILFDRLDHDYMHCTLGDVIVKHVIANCSIS